MEVRGGVLWPDQWVGRLFGASMGGGRDDGRERRNASARAVDAVGITTTTGGAGMDDRGHDERHVRSALTATAAVIAVIDSTAIGGLCGADMGGEGDDVGEKYSASAGAMAPVGAIATVLCRLLSHQ